MAWKPGAPADHDTPPSTDIQAFGNDELLAKYGLKANDAILAEEKYGAQAAKIVRKAWDDVGVDGAGQKVAEPFLPKICWK